MFFELDRILEENVVAYFRIYRIFLVGLRKASTASVTIARVPTETRKGQFPDTN